MNITLIRRTQIPFVASKFGQLKSQAKKCGVNKSFIMGLSLKLIQKPIDSQHIFDDRS